MLGVLLGLAFGDGAPDGWRQSVEHFHTPLTDLDLMIDLRSCRVIGKQRCSRAEAIAPTSVRHGRF
jgi:hypothetical protein